MRPFFIFCAIAAMSSCVHANFLTDMLGWTKAVKDISSATTSGNPDNSDETRSSSPTIISSRNSHVENEENEKTPTPAVAKSKVPAAVSKFFAKAPPKVFAPVYRNVNASTTPVRHQFDDYLMKKVTEAVARLGKMTKLLIIGDALFYKLSKTKERWNPLESRFAAINLGAPGDRTESILKRFEDGQCLRNITAESPKVLLMVGASNALLRDSPVSIMNGLDAVLNILRTYLRKPKFMLCSLVPRAFPGGPVNETIKEVNQLIAAEYGANRYALPCRLPSLSLASP